MLKTRLGSRIKSIIYITVHHAWIDWKVGNFNSFSQVFFMPCFFLKKKSTSSALRENFDTMF